MQSDQDAGQYDYELCSDCAVTVRNFIEQLNQ